MSYFILYRAMVSFSEPVNADTPHRRGDRRDDRAGGDGHGPGGGVSCRVVSRRVRYTSMSLPYHFGNGWFGGFLPLIATALVARTGNIYAGLAYPVVIAFLTFVVGSIVLPETRHRRSGMRCGAFTSSNTFPGLRVIPPCTSAGVSRDAGMPHNPSASHAHTSRSSPRRRRGTVLSTIAGAQLSAPLDSAALAAFRWRSIGPANMGGRVTDIEVDPRNSKVFYVATAAGGIWKTVNAGTMFFPLFDKERVISLGDIAIAPSNGDIIYAGTGEEDSRNSISPGGGIYKSTDAGKTWKLMGLEKTQQIGRIVVDPRDPNIVYVAALGQSWGFNPERGLYKSHRRRNDLAPVKFISDKAGFVDLAMDPVGQ